ncbi:hypothetical protein SUDANB1_03593 [Streptomyces sp. enrichment culture]|uniref:hypothetical protein n=1 Tax=Streptomyces sp. enrichment culture TaxID=1795815 RepID=UPI003F5496F6
MKAIGVGTTEHPKSGDVRPEDPGHLVVSGAEGDGDRFAEDVPSRNDLFTELAGPAVSAASVVLRTRESALSRSLLEPFASSRS